MTNSAGPTLEPTPPPQALPRPELERDTSSKRKFSFLNATRYRVELPEAIRNATVVKNGLIIGSLPNDYQPTPLDIVCGRGRGNYNCPGNLLFRQIVAESVDKYLAASGNKQAKTEVLMYVLRQVQEQSQGKCKFIKQSEEGVWCQLNEVACREKAGHAMREACATRKKLNTSKKKKSTSAESSENNKNLLDSINSAATASTASSSRSGLTYTGDSSRTDFTGAASLSGGSSRSLQMPPVLSAPQPSLGQQPMPPSLIMPHTNNNVATQDFSLQTPMPPALNASRSLQMPMPASMMVTKPKQQESQSARNLTGSRQNSARNLLSSVGNSARNLLGGGKSAPSSSLLGDNNNHEFDIGNLSDELQSRMSLNDPTTEALSQPSTLDDVPPKRKSLEEPLGEHFTLGVEDNDDTEDTSSRADDGFPTVAAHAGGKASSSTSGKVFGQAVADLPHRKQSLLSGGDSVLSAVGSSTFLANQRSSDFFAQFTE